MMKQIEVYKNVFLAISITSLMIVMILGSFSSLFLNKNYYESLYTKTGAYERLDKEIVSNKTYELFMFFESKGSLDENFYTPNEISHLDDVKELVTKIFVFYYLALFSLLISILFLYRYFKKELYLLFSKIIFYSGILVLVVALLFFIFNFSGIFERFHELFFKDNYTFPTSSNMIKMFNEDFFRLFAARIFEISIFKALIASVIGGLLIFKNKSKIKKLTNPSHKGQKS